MKNTFLQILTATLIFTIPLKNFAQAPDLGAAEDFVLFTSAGAFNVAGASTLVTGDVGTDGGAFNGFPPGVLIGQIHIANAVTAAAAMDLGIAYGSMSTITCGQVISTTMGGGQILTPDVYCTGAATIINGNLILDAQGDPNAEFIFKFDGALATGVGSQITLINGASFCNVWWQVNGEVDLGENSVFQGNILLNGAINLLDGATLFGRALSVAGAISLQNNQVTIGVPPIAAVITANGNPTTFCAGGSVVLTGNIDGMWNTGATTPSITVTTSGEFYVTNTTNCGSIISNIIIVTVNPLPVCDISGSTSFCSGGSTQICATSGAASYLWSTGANTACIMVSTGGIYTVTITDANNCSSICSEEVFEDPLPVCNITGNTSICQGASTQLCVLPGATSYLWSNGATTNCITVSTAGTYSVTITDNNGCSSSCSQVVTLNSNPICMISGNTSFCEGSFSQLCAPAGAASYIWSNGATTNCITVSTPGTYSVTITDSNGCSSNCSQQIIQNPLPLCTITGSPTFCSGSSTELCVLPGATSYLWNTGATTNCITVDEAGMYSVTITDANGCSSNCTQEVLEDDNTLCIITGNPSFCPGGSTELCVPPGAASYIWNTGETTNCILADAAGMYSVTITYNNGCSSECSQEISETNNPVCIITGNTSFCSGGSTQICVPTGAMSYMWSTGEFTNCITVNEVGIYFVTVTYTNDCISICGVEISESNNPTCIITGEPSFCFGGSTQLCGPGGAESYVWNTGETSQCITVSLSGTYSLTVTETNGCISLCSVVVLETTNTPCIISGIPSFCDGGSTQLCVPAGAMSYLWSNGATTNCIAVNELGLYTVTVTYVNGCTSICSQEVIESNNPICIITGNPSFCPGGSTQLCVLDAASNYIWSNGSTSNCIIVNVSGLYTVTVTYGNGCTSICSQEVIESNSPICIISGNPSFCPEDSTLLCVPAGAMSYLWSTGDTTNCISVNEAGTYSVTITYGNECVSVCSRIVIENNNPVCNIITNSLLCTGDSIQLCVPEGAMSYVWSNGATTHCITVNESGTYSVTITYSSGCVSICSKTVMVQHEIPCIITGNYNICQGGITNLCVHSGYTSYLWSTGHTTNCIPVDCSGTFCVTVTNEDGCILTCCKTVNMGHGNPACIITGNNIICEGSSTVLCAPLECVSYLWSTGSTSRCITVDSGGFYFVTVTYAGGYNSICCIPVEVITEIPNFVISGNSNICLGGITTLCAPSDKASYLWSTGSVSRCLIVDIAGTYYVTVTDVSGCVSIGTKTVIVSSDIPGSAITGNGNICEGKSTMLCAPPGYASYLWSKGVTTQCIIVTTSGTHTVTVTNFGGCSNTGLKTVVVNPKPICIIEGNLFPDMGQPTTLCAPFGFNSYVWSSGATTQCNIVTTAGIHAVTVTNSMGCTSSCSVNVMYNNQSELFHEEHMPDRYNNFNVVVYPNPFNSKAIIEFQNTETDSHVLIELFNLAGAKLASLVNMEIKKGTIYQTEVNAGDLRPGIYIYRIVNGDQVIINRLLLIN